MNPDLHSDLISIEDSKVQYEKLGIETKLKCNVKECNRTAAYSIPNNPPARCSKHSQFGDCIFPSVSCQVKYCAGIAQYADLEIGRPSFCKDHSTKQMKNLVNVNTQYNTYFIIKSLLASTPFKLVKSDNDPTSQVTDFSKPSLYLNKPYYIYKSPIGCEYHKHHVIVSFSMNHPAAKPFEGYEYSQNLCNFVRKFGGTVSIIMLNCKPYINRAGWKSVQDRKEEYLMIEFTKLMNSIPDRNNPNLLINDMIYIDNSPDDKKLVTVTSYKDLAEHYNDSFIKHEKDMKRKQEEKKEKTIKERKQMVIKAIIAIIACCCIQVISILAS